MKVNKRFKILLSTIVFMMISTVALVAVVLASENQNVDSDIDLQYKEAVFQVSAEYYMEGDRGMSELFTKNDLKNVYQSKDIIENETTMCLNKFVVDDNILLKDEVAFVVFEYKCQNLSSDETINIGVSSVNSNDSVNLSYFISYSRLNLVGSNADSVNQTDFTIAEVELGIDDIVYIYIKAKLNDTTEEVNVSSIVDGLYLIFSESE